MQKVANRRFAFALTVGVSWAAGVSLAQSPDKPAATDGTAIPSSKFSPDGSSVRPALNIKMKEAEKATTKEGLGDNTITIKSFDRLHKLTRGRESKTYDKGMDDKKKPPDGAVVRPTDIPGPAAEPHGRGSGEGKTSYTSKDFEDSIGASKLLNSSHKKGDNKKKKEGDDDAELNAAACKAAAAARKPLPSFCKPQTIPIDRSFIDRMEADRMEQLRAGPGGFNPNKP
jgi:hypothetical protein